MTRSWLPRGWPPFLAIVAMFAGAGLWSGRAFTTGPGPAVAAASRAQAATVGAMVEVSPITSIDPRGLATVTVVWSAAGAPGAQLWFVVDRGPPTLCMPRASGSIEINWLALGHEYEFRVHGGAPGGEPLARAALIAERPAALAPPAHQGSMRPLRAELRAALRGIDPWPGVAFALLAAASVGAALCRSARVARASSCASALVPLALVLAGVLAVRPRPLAEQPYPDSQQYADAARHLASGDGYVTTVDVRGGAPAPPRYPPGYSLALAPFAAFGSYPANVQLGAKAYAAGYVLALAAAAWAAGGPLAAGLVTVCAGASPFAAGAATLVLSDALAAAGTLLTLLLLSGAPTRGRAAAAGLLSGLLLVVRFAMVWNLVAVLAALRRPQRKWALWLALAPLLGLALYQWRAFGSPWRTGYDGSIQGLKLLDVAYAFGGQASDGPWVFPDALHGSLMRWACPNPGWAGGPEAHVPALVAYPATVLGLFWVMAPPLLGAAGLLWVLRRRDEPGPRFTLVLTAAVVLFHCVYYFAGARFVAAPASLLAVYGAVALSAPLRRLAARARDR